MTIEQLQALKTYIDAKVVHMQAPIRENDIYLLQAEEALDRVMTSALPSQQGNTP